MRVLIVNTSELAGGAAVASKRLMKALNNNGVKSKMLVAVKKSRDIEVVGLGRKWLHQLFFLIDRLAIFLHLHLKKQHLWEIDTASIGHDITLLPEFKEADIIHLQWINQGMLSLRGIRKILESGKPVVWTMHDMWPFTAVCHHRYGCRRLEEGCGTCPYLPRPCKNDLSRRVFRRKKRIAEGGWKNLCFVAVSNWLRDEALKSPLTTGYRVEVIGNPISLKEFPLGRHDGKGGLLNMPGKRIIVFGAARIDARIKGFGFLKEALRLLVEQNKADVSHLHLAVYGGVKDTSALEDIAVSHTYLGPIPSSQLSLLFGEAAVVVSSSYYETFGQTLLEALACGCVPVAFDGSGTTDIIQHKQNGYLARHEDAADLAEGIAWALGCGLSPEELRASIARKFSESSVANKYIELYRQMEGGRK